VTGFGNLKSRAGSTLAGLGFEVHGCGKGTGDRGPPVGADRTAEGTQVPPVFTGPQFLQVHCAVAMGWSLGVLSSLRL
jgi:hypothetical protein